MEHKAVTIVGVAICEGQRKSGVELGPRLLIDDYGLAGKIKELGHSVQVDADLADHDSAELLKIAKDTATNRDLKTQGVSPIASEPLHHPLIHHAAYVSAVNKELCRRVLAHASKADNSFVLTVGGDHSLGLGSVAGMALRHAELRLIWIDAHADINTADTTESGNLHGCPVGFLLGLDAGAMPNGDLAWARRPDGTPLLRPEQIVYIGLRDVDEGEKITLRKYGIRAFSMHEVDHYGIQRVVEMAMQHIDPFGKHPIHVSFDIDSLDPVYAPSTGTPVPGGLSVREGRYICETVAASGRLCSMDIVEVNPVLCAPEKHLVKATADAACMMVRAALGHKLL